MDELMAAAEASEGGAGRVERGRVWRLVAEAEVVLSAALVGRAIAHRWEGVGWMGGRVVKHYPGAGKKGRTTGVMCNFDVSYADGETIGHSLSMQRYAVGGLGEIDSNGPGSWVLLQEQ
jgi:hypothetical protein